MAWAKRPRAVGPNQQRKCRLLVRCRRLSCATLARTDRASHQGAALPAAAQAGQDAALLAAAARESFGRVGAALVAAVGAPVTPLTRDRAGQQASVQQRAPIYEEAAAAPAHSPLRRRRSRPDSSCDPFPAPLRFHHHRRQRISYHLGPNMLELFKLIMAAVLLAHYVACLFYVSAAGAKHRRWRSSGLGTDGPADSFKGWQRARNNL